MEQNQISLKDFRDKVEDLGVTFSDYELNHVFDAVIQSIPIDKETGLRLILDKETLNELVILTIYKYQSRLANF